MNTMFQKRFTFLLLLLFGVISGFAQSNQEKTGYSFGALGSFDQYYLTEQIGSNPALTFGSEKRFPEQFNLGYQLGFISKKKYWHQSYLGFTYFPAYTRTYTQVSNDGNIWTYLSGERNQEMELYLMDISKTFKVNLFFHRFYLNFGGGASGGVIRWPKSDQVSEDMFFFTGQIWPFAGIEVMLFKGMGIFAEMRYHLGLSESITSSTNGITSEWSYRLSDEEIRVGINFYFSKK